MTEMQLTLDEAVRERNAVLALIAADPLSTPTVQAVADAIETTTTPGDVVSANDIRPLLPPWVRGFAIGPAFAQLVRRGALRRLDWVPSTDPGTHGKPVNRYLVLGGAA